MAKYYTYAHQVQLKQGETLGFTAGKGYYAKPLPSTIAKTPEYDGVIPYLSQGQGVKPDPKTGIPQNAPLTPPQPTPESKPGEIPEPQLAIDWKSWLQDWGFPTDVVNTLDSMARKYTPAQADLFTRDAILYLRGTDWHKNTFVGFADAYKAGLVQDERQYRQYVQHANDAYKRYHGRDITSAELVSAFTSGYDPTRLERELEGAAYINANRADVQYLGGAFGGGQFSEGELGDLGRQYAGIGTALGPQLLKRVEEAQARARRIFEGTLATGNLRPTSVSSGNTLSDIGR